MSEEQKEISTENIESSFNQMDEVNLNPSNDNHHEPIGVSRTDVTSDDNVSSSTSSDTVEPFEPTSVEVIPPEQIISLLQQDIESLNQQIEEQTQQVDTLKKRYISQAAEFDNYRKRTAKEKEELELKVKCKTLAELLDIVDTFELARAQIKPGDEGEMAIQKSYQGVYKKLVDTLKKLGVSAMRPEGEPFDPAYHEAMLTEYTNEYPEGTVIDQLRRGYLLGDQVLRHAMVKVSAANDSELPPASDNLAGEIPTG